MATPQRLSAVREKGTGTFPNGWKRASPLFLLLLLLAGCAQLAVAPMPNPEVGALSADDVALVMRSAGFTDEEILQLGAGLRNQLASAGAARIREGEKVMALFAVHGDNVYVSSVRRGSFMYNMKTQTLR